MRKTRQARPIPKGFGAPKPPRKEKPPAPIHPLKLKAIMDDLTYAKDYLSSVLNECIKSNQVIVSFAPAEKTEFFYRALLYLNKEGNFPDVVTDLYNVAADDFSDVSLPNSCMIVATPRAVAHLRPVLNLFQILDGGYRPENPVTSDFTLVAPDGTHHFQKPRDLISHD